MSIEERDKESKASEIYRDSIVQLSTLDDVEYATKDEESVYIINEFIVNVHQLRERKLSDVILAVKTGNLYLIKLESANA